MQVIRQLPEKPIKPCVLALGNFDGVHLGHRRLLESGLQIARKMGIGLSVLLYEPHPLKVLFPEKMIGLLTTSEERLKLLELIGVDTVYLLPFNHDTANIPPETFVSDILVRLGTRYAMVGFNYSFGAKGKGSPEDLQRLGPKYGFGVSVLQAQTMGGEVISSSSIRQALLQGDMRQAQKMLGRYPFLCGRVVHGEQRGRDLGYPTANLEVCEDLLVPKPGSYAVWAEFDGQKVMGMLNIGKKPTFHTEYETTVEVHLLNFYGNLYDKMLSMYLVERLRDERKFSSINELLNQLQKDKEHTQRVLEDEGELDLRENALYKS